MDQEPKPVIAEILGRPLQITGAIPPDRLQVVAGLVDENLRALQQACPSSPLADLAILAALFRYKHYKKSVFT